MKNTLRFVLGLTSTALLAMGLARAADRLDPINQNLPATGAALSGTAPNCTTECFFTGPRD